MVAGGEVPAVTNRFRLGAKKGLGNFFTLRGFFQSGLAQGEGGIRQTQTKGEDKGEESRDDPLCLFM